MKNPQMHLLLLIFPEAEVICFSDAGNLSAALLAAAAVHKALRIVLPVPKSVDKGVKFAEAYAAYGGRCTICAVDTLQKVNRRQ